MKELKNRRIENEEAYSGDSVDNTQQISLDEIAQTVNSSESRNAKALKKKKNKKNRRIAFASRILWAVLLIAAIAFTVIFCWMPMFPAKWKIAAAVVLVILLGAAGYFTFTKRKRFRRKTIVCAVNAVLAVLLAIASVIMPYYKGRVSQIIEDNQISSGTVRVNVYVMSENYRAAHPEIEWKTVSGITEETSDAANLKAYVDAGACFATSSTNDNIYLNSAEEKLKDFAGEFRTDDKTDLNAVAEAFYSGEDDALLMTESVAYMIRDMEEYKNWDDDVTILCTIYVDEIEQEVKINDTELTSQPFSVFFGGNDQTGELNLTGRTDVDMIVTVNPTTHQIVISSFPRDSYIPNPALNWSCDKLTHLGMHGISNTLEGLSSVLGTNIDNYILINFTTYMKIIDALGGVDVENPYEFTYTWDENYVYPEGTIHLDGQAALYYVRERYSLPDGDFGRNMHQQLVMQAIIRKVSSPAIIADFNNLLNALEGTFLTNLSDSSIYGFCQYQLQENISWNVVTNRVVGGVGYAVCATAPSQELSCVFPYANQVEFMAQQIAAVVNGELIEQQDMPDGSGYLYDPVHNEQTYEEEETPVYEETTPEPVYEETTPEPVQEETAPPEEVPAETQEPEEPEQPEESEEPVEPEQPEESEEPAEPEQPEESAGSGSSGETGTETQSEG